MISSLHMLTRSVDTGRDTGQWARESSPAGIHGVPALLQAVCRVLQQAIRESAGSLGAARDSEARPGISEPQFLSLRLAGGRHSRSMTCFLYPSLLFG